MKNKNLTVDEKYWLKKIRQSSPLTPAETEVLKQFEKTAREKYFIHKFNYSYTPEDETLNDTTAQPEWAPPKKPLLRKMTNSEVVQAFFSLLCFEAVKLAWKHQAAIYHPDRPSGNPERATQLNETWARIKNLYGMA
jgi:hypothetical protein